MRTEVFATYGGWSYLPDYPTTADLDRGEIFKLADQRNDELLINLKYVTPVESGAKKYQCDTCGRKFIDQATFVGHKRKSSCPKSQEDTSQGLTRSDVARMLDADPEKVKIDDAPDHHVDTHTDVLG